MEQKNSSRIELPQWFLEETPAAAKPVHTKQHFIRKTMKNLSEVFENDFYFEKFASMPLFLQGIDARVKIIIFFIFILFGNLADSLAAFIALAFVPLIYAKLSGLELKSYFRRVWCYVPLLVLLCSVPGASSLFVRGTPVVWLISPGGFGVQEGVYFSVNGITMALRIFLRTGISLSFTFLLLLTTRWSNITGALAAMHVPLLFISVLNMAYRYLFVLANAAGDLMQARFLRTVGQLETGVNRRFMGHSAAHLFLKSHFLSGEIYDAMCCRGFTGKPVSLTKGKVAAKDVFFLVSNVLILLILIVEEILF